MAVSSSVVLLGFLVSGLIQIGVHAYQVCPKVTSDMVGTCDEECSSDDDCTGGKLCCSNGCGHVCTIPVYIPYHPPPLVCPDVSSDVVGTCAEECGSGCSKSDELCCSNGCGHTCVKAVTPSPLCSHIREGLLNGTMLIGAYVPQCEEDGSFSPHQCHGSTGYCWCVNTTTGYPISEQIRFKMPQCSCSHEGKVYSIGESFSVQKDGSCGECSCNVSGGIQCVYSECAAAASEDVVYYSCPALASGNSDNSGDCDSSCNSESDCHSPLRCCSDGCGKSCQQPSRIPYVKLPTSSSLTQCPDPTAVPCADHRQDDSTSSCLNDGSDCEAGTRCCEDACSTGVCLSTSFADPTPCFTATKMVKQSNFSGLLGHYSPECTTQGLFRPIQCHQHYCWCVDINSGHPLSDLATYEQANVLQCAGCVYNGVNYKHLESFPSGDGCNDCSCVGGYVACTEIGCGWGPADVWRTSEGVWGRWHSVLIACIIIVVVLVAIVLALLVGVMMMMKQNSKAPRHHRLKKEAVLLEDHEMVEYGGDHESVELKVPVEDFTKLNTCAT